MAAILSLPQCVNSLWLSNIIWHQTSWSTLVHVIIMAPCLSGAKSLTHWPLGDFNLILESWFFKLILVNGGWDISYEIALRRMPQDLTDDKSTLVQVMAWCRQAASHYLGQCWPRSMSPFGVTRPQWVNWINANLLTIGPIGTNFIENWVKWKHKIYKTSEDVCPRLRPNQREWR